MTEPSNDNDRAEINSAPTKQRKRRWWMIALAVAAGLLLGWQAAALAQHLMGHGSGEARDAAITSPQAR